MKRAVNIGGNSMNNPMGFSEREGIETYLSEIYKYTPLDRDEEIRLARLIQDGDEKAFETFVNHNLRLVVSTAKLYMHNGLNLEDLIQYGNIGLMKAARLYTKYMSNRFSSFAVWHIRKEITDAIEEVGYTIRNTHANCVMRREIRKVTDAFELVNGRKPTPDEIAGIINANKSADDKTVIDGEKVRSVMGSFMEGHSTDKTVDSDDDESQTFGDLLPSAEKTDVNLRTEDTRTEVEGMLSVLTERERKVVTMTFGIGYDYEYEPSCIADRMGLGVERVRQILKESMKKLRAVAAK